MNSQLDYHYGIRFCCVLFIWAALGGTISSIENQYTFFSTLILYLLPLTLDYYSHMPIKEKNIKRKSVGIWSTLIAVTFLIGILFFLILSGINVEKFILSGWFKSFVWICCGFYAYLAAIDWLEYSSEEEKRFRTKIREKLREENWNETFVDRVEYYKEKSENLPQVK